MSMGNIWSAWTRNLLAVALVGCGFAAQAADPYVGCIYPAGLQVGTTNRVAVIGQFFWNVAGMDAGAGVKVVKWELVPNFPVPTGDQRKYLVKWLNQIAEGNRVQPRLPVENEHFNEWRSNRWYSALGDLDEGQLALVERYLHTPRNPLQMSPALSQTLLVTLAVAPDARPGPREFRVFGLNGTSPPRPLLVTSEPHHVEPLYVPPHRTQPARPRVVDAPCWLDGQIWPGSTDRWILPLRKDQTVTLRVVARELQPYIGDAVPGFFNSVLRLVDSQGAEVAFADDYRHHPDSVLTVTAPRDDDYVLEVHDNLYRGRDDFVYSIEVRPGTVHPKMQALSLSPLPDWSIPENAIVQAFTGTVSRAGRPVEHVLEIPRPCELGFDLLARRTGSPLDARLTVLDGMVPLARFDDVTNSIHLGSVIQAECDPVGRVRFDHAGRYVLRVEDEAGHGGADFSYVLRVHRPAPRFEVWCHRSGFALRGRNGAVATVFDVIRRDGFVGDVRLEPNAFVTFNRPLIPAASNRVSVVVVNRRQEVEPATNMSFFASAQIDGRRVTVPVVPANEYNQAFAWDHLVPARDFLFKTLVPARPKKDEGKKAKKAPMGKPRT